MEESRPVLISSRNSVDLGPTIISPAQPAAIYLKVNAVNSRLCLDVQLSNSPILMLTQIMTYVCLSFDADRSK